jgi:AraC-like DNA-binding protein
MRFREPIAADHSQVVGAGWIRNKRNTVIDRDYRAYALLYLVSGSGFYADASIGRRVLSAGDLLVLFPGRAHSYGPLTPGQWDECWVGFSGGVFAALEADGVLDPAQPILRPGVDGDLVAAFDACVGAIDRQRGDSDRQLVARVHQLCVSVVERVRRGASGGLADAALALLAADLGRPLDLVAVARRLGVGYDTLRRAVVAATGISPLRWRTLRRIERAKELLVAGWSAQRVAEQLGYCDRFFFARQFRQVVGKPPMAWRAAFAGQPARDSGRATPT